LDRRLPDGVGEQILACLPKCWSSPPPAIMVTGFSDVGGAIQALRLGARDYIVKPIKAESLRASIARTLGQKPAQPPTLIQEVRTPVGEPPPANRLTIALAEVVGGVCHDLVNQLGGALMALAGPRKDAARAMRLIGQAADTLHTLHRFVRPY